MATKAHIVDRPLRGLFKALEARPVPEHLRRVVDHLEPAAPARAGRN